MLKMLEVLSVVWLKSIIGLISKCLLPRGKRLLSVSADATARVFDLATFKCEVMRLSFHSSAHFFYNSSSLRPKPPTLLLTPSAHDRVHPKAPTILYYAAPLLFPPNFTPKSSRFWLTNIPTSPNLTFPTLRQHLWDMRGRFVRVYSTPVVKEWPQLVLIKQSKCGM